MHQVVHSTLGAIVLTVAHNGMKQLYNTAFMLINAPSLITVPTFLYAEMVATMPTKLGPTKLALGH